MAQIPRSLIENYTAAINRISAECRRSLTADLAGVDLSGDVPSARDAVIAVMHRWCGAATDLSSVLAAEFYDGLRESEVGERLGAIAESGRAPEATEGAVRAFVDDLVEGKHDKFMNELVDRLDYETKKSAAETVYVNGRRDAKRPRFARVPSGSETCEFCIMLASRGFVYHSEQTAGKEGHYHANCDCRIVPGWDDETKVEGYEPDELYKLYKAGYRKRCSSIDSKLARPARELRKREKYIRKHAEQMSDDKRAEYERNLREFYHEKIGSYIESFSKDGRIHAEYGAIPHGKEILAGEVLARDGHEITYLRERDEKGVKNIDIVMDGKLFELKCVDPPRQEQTGSNPMRYVESNYRKAVKQFESPHYDVDGVSKVSGGVIRMVFDARGRDDPDSEVESLLRERNSNGKVNTLLLIGQFEDIIDVKKET